MLDSGDQWEHTRLDADDGVVNIYDDHGTIATLCDDRNDLKSNTQLMTNAQRMYRLLRAAHRSGVLRGASVDGECLACQVNRLLAAIEQGCEEANTP
jgi:hypothetical protein